MKQKFTLEIKIEAIAEIEDAYYWYEERQPKLGVKFQKQLDRSIKSIFKAPNGFKLVYKNQRQIPVDKFPFVIVYEVLEAKIVIFSVFHTSRNPDERIR